MLQLNCHLALFVACPLFYEAQLSLFVASAILGDVGQSPFFPWQAYLVTFNCHFLWPAPCLMMLDGHFGWQVQYLVKFREIAGAQNIVFFNTKCGRPAPKGTSVVGRQAHGRSLGPVGQKPFFSATCHPWQSSMSVINRILVMKRAAFVGQEFFASA